jgi:hypothetical protein
MDLTSFEILTPCIMCWTPHTTLFQIWLPPKYFSIFSFFETQNPKYFSKFYQTNPSQVLFLLYSFYLDNYFLAPLVISFNDFLVLLYIFCVLRLRSSALIDMYYTTYIYIKKWKQKPYLKYSENHKNQ